MLVTIYQTTRCHNTDYHDTDAESVDFKLPVGSLQVRPGGCPNRTPPGCVVRPATTIVNCMSRSNQQMRTNNKYIFHYLSLVCICWLDLHMDGVQNIKFVNCIFTVKTTQWFRRLGIPLTVTFTRATREQATTTIATLCWKKTGLYTPELDVCVALLLPALILTVSHSLCVLKSLWLRLFKQC
jgi:hypothetical protein